MGFDVEAPALFICEPGRGGRREAFAIGIGFEVCYTTSTTSNPKQGITKLYGHAIMGYEILRLQPAALRRILLRHIRSRLSGPVPYGYISGSGRFMVSGPFPTTGGLLGAPAILPAGVLNRCRTWRELWVQGLRVGTPMRAPRFARLCPSCLLRSHLCLCVPSGTVGARHASAVSIHGPGQLAARK